MDSINISDFIRGSGGQGGDRTHAKALRYSLYNAATLIIAGVILGALVSVYFVLEAFIQPLVWAILIGCVLFPIKLKLTQWGRSWLRGLKVNKTPFSLGVILLPLKMTDAFSEQLWSQFISYWKTFIVLLSIGVSIYVLSSFTLFEFLLYPVTIIWNVCQFFYTVLGFFRAEWVWTLALVYLITVFFLEEPVKAVCPLDLSNFAVFIWISLIFHVSTFLGLLRLPICLAVSVAFAVGSWNTLKAWIYTDECNESTETEEDPDRGHEAEHTLEDVEEESETLQNQDAGDREAVSRDVSPEDVIKDPKEEPTSKAASSNQVPERHAPRTKSASDCAASVGEDGEAKEANRATASPTRNDFRRRRMTSPLPYRNRSFSIASALDSIKDMTPFAVFVTRRKSETVINSSFSPRTVVNRCFLKLLIACILVYVFKHPTILTLLPLPVSFIVIKRSGVFVWTRYKPLSFIDEEKQALIVPKPIRALWSVVSKGDQKILAMIEDTISKVTTIVLLCFILLFAITFFIVIVAQVQRESVQLVWTTANLVNETVSRNPEIAKWLPQSDTMQSTLSSVIDKGYEHGREWMAKKVSGIITESEDPKGVERLKIEKELLAVIDELYKSWHTNHTAPVSGIIELCKLGLTACPAAATTNPSDPLTNLDSTTGRKDSATQTTQESWTSPAQIRLAIDSMMKSAWVTAQLKDILDVNRVMEIVRNNIGSVISVMESLWLIFRSNVHSVVNFATAMISLLFGGGTALLNFVVSTVVFLTTLFYLLSTSENDYKPIGWMTSFAGPVFPTSEFEAAISSVLLATLKMAVFYGLYTWLTHTIFGINIVFIPSALAAIFAAVPFLGTYWAAVPAMVELWIVKGDRLRAILLFLSHLLPTYVIDIMIYADIKDGGHPYLTGLAIVGGIYYLGLQGAIIGPILLCCLIVVFNIYKAMLSVEAGVSESSDPASDQPPRPNSQFRNSVPDIYLHRSTPPSVSTPHGGAGANPLVSPSTPNSVFSPNHALLRKAVFGSARMQRSNSLPNVDEVESNATDQ